MFLDMVVTDIREGLNLFDQAFSIHQQIPEFQINSTTYQQLIERINYVKQPLIFVAYVEDQPVGYLMGYERYDSFYIWLAGVLPNHRREGVFVQLMNAIEQWAMKKNYRLLTTKTRNCFKSMLLFLIAHDFKLSGIDKRDSIDSHRLLLEKLIASRS